MSSNCSTLSINDCFISYVTLITGVYVLLQTISSCIYVCLIMAFLDFLLIQVVLFNSCKYIIK